MSFQKYVDHISQKYRLAVAISVIKTKPKNLSIDDYLNQLQTKIKNEEFDPNETVCSDDFNFDDDDILKDNTQIDNKCDMLNKNRLDCSVNESERSQTILNDLVFEDGRLEVNVDEESSIGDTLRLLKEVATVAEEEDNANQNLSQLTFCESQEFINNANDVTHCYGTTNAMDDNKLIPNGNKNNRMDSQATQLYTLHGFTQDYTHVSQTQEEYFVIADKYIRNNANNINHIQSNVHNVKDTNKHNGNDIQVYINDEKTQNILAITVDGRESIGKIYGPQPSIENYCGNTKPSQLVHNITKDNAYNATKNVNDVEILNVDTQKIEFNVNNVATDKFAANNYTDEAIRKVNTYNDRVEMNSGTKVNKATEIGNGTPILLFHSQNTVANEFTVSDGLQNIGIDHKDTQNINKDITQNTQSLDIKDVQDDNGNIENDMEIDLSESEENTQETVPFKVIEEMNRVKNFVNKKDKRYDGCSTDSGYRSDSQVRSSLKTSASQLNGAWLNQSAHYLFNHILQASATDDIVKQIAQVLGKLIDKLHEDENYPHFLEELLETVDRMLLDLRVGGGWADDVLITKDETIQRLLLLNKSKHILKYSIEKITNTLQELHTNLTQEDLYELTSIVELENICYIFHILEALLKRYMKVKDVASQNTQNSQEDMFPTRSSLTELWRKKWYPNGNKEMIKNENKICVLKSCSEILNKIIVECMDGYSLVAFAALQCFNLIQG